MTAALRVSGLGFSYSRSPEPVLSDVEAAVYAGEAVALTGPSGRGKSTLLYLLGLLLTPSEGEVEVQGRPTSKLSDAQRSVVRARRMGFVFQDSQLDPTRSVLDSVIEPALYAGLRRDAAIERAIGLLDAFGVEARANHLPGQISGGQAQRVALCRALVNQPAIILADEPTGNLDHANAEVVLDRLTRAAKEESVALIVATHDPFVVSRLDRVIAL
ncbi:MAG: ABC transporter ATP-binding protein [Tessaracoccus sp.]|uniref:ABC transporter ATP-binding protein n=1 Tax=Tessaracoccus sp. TaxID=1971211 RepID=UPI001EBE92B0|nr:ABC transporter ATP-binding protein [Tessaracoccus sp.]MBK7821125.1 ABC transporter ATP-binding protein [Tessaracoccus sp.]